MRKGARILVTGANGFVGRAVCSALTKAGYEVRLAGRREVGEIHRATEWRNVLEGCTAVVHLAARVHQMTVDSQTDLAAFREVNVHGTANLVRQALESGVQRFVFMSSIKVLGDKGLNLSANHPLAPADAYGVSKAEAEAALQAHMKDAPEASLVILRPPLVYGPGVRANFEKLMSLTSRGWPLPFGAIQNQRSLISVQNLADAICYSLACTPGIYHPRDTGNMSTAELVQCLAAGMDRPCRLWSCPVGILQLAGRLTGKYPAIMRLTGSLTTDGKMDGWTPPIAGKTALEETARAFINHQG